MSSTDRLLTNYSRQVRLPWSANMSGKQRVWFAVYPPVEERRVRARLQEFENGTREANHGWINVGLDTPSPGIPGGTQISGAYFSERDRSFQKYRDRYFWGSEGR